MRAKVFLTIVLLSGGLLVLAAWVRAELSRSTGPSVGITASANSQIDVPPSSVGEAPSVAGVKGPPQAPAGGTTASSAKEGAAPVAVSPDYPDRVLSGLVDPDREVRRTALAEAVQLDDRSVVPYLRDLAHHTEDPQEKADILAAIDFINLPSVTETLAEQQAARSAAGQSEPRRSLTNRWTGKPFVRASH